MTKNQIIDKLRMYLELILQQSITEGYWFEGIYKENLQKLLNEANKYSYGKTTRVPPKSIFTEEKLEKFSKENSKTVNQLRRSKQSLLRGIDRKYLFEIES